MADFFDEEDADSSSEVGVDENAGEYKGYFVENEEEEKKFYEFGAHFPYKYLYQKLEILAKERKNEKRSLEKKLINKDKLNSNDSLNLNSLLGNVNKKVKSRNKGDGIIGLTYKPAGNMHINNPNDVMNLNKFLSNKKIMKTNNNENKYIALGNNNLSDLIKLKNNKKYTKNSKKPNNYTKLRKRNDKNNSYINNLTNNKNNTYSHYMKERKRMCTKLTSYGIKSNNKKEYSQKLKKYKSKKPLGGDQSSEKKKLIFELTKRKNNGGVIFANKLSISKCYGYQNSKNVSTTKNRNINFNNIKKIGTYNKKEIYLVPKNKNIITNGKNKNSETQIYNVGKKNEKSRIINVTKDISVIEKANRNFSIKKKICLTNSNKNKLINNKKRILIKQITKPSTGTRNQLTFIDNISIKNDPNKISRNLHKPLIINYSNNCFVKDLTSVNQKVRVFKPKVNSNLGNLTQDIRPKKESKIKVNEKCKISKSNINLVKTQQKKKDNDDSKNRIKKQKIELNIKKSFFEKKKKISDYKIKDENKSFQNKNSSSHAKTFVKLKNNQKTKEVIKGNTSINRKKKENIERK